VSPAQRPLEGWRILITRPAEQAASFAATLAAAGAVPLAYPTITLAPPPGWQALDEALTRQDRYGWVIFTSPSAVRFTAQRAADLALPGPLFNGIPIAAVGTETARALSRHGLTAAVTPPEDDQRQEGLASALAHLGAGTRVLFPQTLGGRELLRDELARRGCIVDVVAVSRTVAVSPLPPPPPFDVATFASPSALRAFVDAWTPTPMKGTIVAVIGPTTAATAAALDVPVDVLPSRPNMAALVDALAHHRASRSPPDDR
jgi:uroporphyrinogen III methyltransferase/synthase